MGSKRPEAFTLGLSGTKARVTRAAAQALKPSNRPGRPFFRRSFTTAYKVRVVLQAEKAAAKGRGALKDYLKREGIYSSQLTQWRRQRTQGLLGKVRRGRPRKSRESLVRENLRLRKKLALLENWIRKAELPARSPQGHAPAGKAAWGTRKRILESSAASGRGGLRLKGGSPPLRRGRTLP